MTLEQAKQELINRYKYLYENSSFILAPFVYEETKEELEEFLKKYPIIETRKPAIYIKLSYAYEKAPLFEEFLLSSKKIEDTTLYKMIESKRNDKEYLEKVKHGLLLVEKENQRNKTGFEFLKVKLSVIKILNVVGDYIENQSGDLINKKRKLHVLDEYYRIYRYNNNGKTYTSGRELNINDCDSLSIPLYAKKTSRDKLDIGIIKNSFITTIDNAPRNEDNWSIFTENEKQQIYLQYHDELPWDLEINCHLEKSNSDNKFDVRLARPDNTNPCNQYFKIKETEIFCKPIEYSQIAYKYEYYQLCPHCGYIVRIPKEILSCGIKKRIEDRCSKDRYLFRKMYLYSELFSLSKNSTNEQKRLLIK